MKDLTDNPLFQAVVVVLVALTVQAIVRRYVDRLIIRAVKGHKYESTKIERQREKTLSGILSTASAVAIWLVAVIMILGSLNVNVAGLATGAGLFGVVVGFGAQNTIRDFLAGIFIIVENQYRVGDVISAKDKTGVVEDISIRVTRLRDLDGNLHIIPNGQIGTVTNMTFEYANVNLNIGLSYDTDIDKAAKVINGVGQELADDEEFKNDVIEPVVFLRVDSFDDSAVTVKALGKVKPGAQWDVAGEFRRRLKLAFEKNKIEIPFPQRVIHTDPKN